MKNLLLTALLLVAITEITPAAAHRIALPTTAYNPVDEKDLLVYAGTYTFAENGTFTKLTITVESGEIYGQVDSNDRYKLVRQPEADTFKSTSSYGSIFTFTRDPNTKAVTGFKMKIMDNNLEGTKDKK